MPGPYDLIFSEATTGRELWRFKNAITIRPMKVADLRIQLRVVTFPEVLALVKPGHEAMTPRMEISMPRAVLESYKVRDDIDGSSTRDAHPGPRRVIDAMVRLSGTQTAKGWQYDGQIIKAGGKPFEFRTPTYLLTGDIVSVQVLSIH